MALIELFTSEGCSSCPPAEKWLGGLRREPGLWKAFVPVAFHVNYWDRLGWRDVLASGPFTDRQHAYARAWNAASVYTPCFVRNGLEWRPRSAPGPSGGGDDAGRLSITWHSADHSGRIAFLPPGAEAKSTTGGRGFQVHVALLGGGIVTRVRKGENAGKVLQHEFVALRLKSVALDPAGEVGGGWTARAVVEPPPDGFTEKLALAAWVTRPGQLVPLQAAGGWLKQASAVP